jgi:lipopolysaccharide transport system permease protein
MLNSVAQLLNSRELLWVWTAREVRVRYKQSFLGAAWAVLQPVVLAIMFSLVFTRVIRVPTGDVPYPIFSYTALLPWTFLATSITFGVSSLVNNMNLVTKIYFPREILPLASILAAGIDFLVASLVLVAMIVFYRTPVTASLLLLPLLVLVQIVLTFGVTLIGSAALVFFRDVRFVVPLFIQLWLYASPVIYPISAVPERWRTLYALNPMVGLLEAYRAILIYGRWPAPGPLLWAALISILLCIVGFWSFKRLEPSFADFI